MDIEELVLSIEQMNHLKELGLEVKNTALYFAKPKCVGGHDYYIVPIIMAEESLYEKIIPTLTLQEILEMLPKKIEINSREYYLFINYQDGEVSYAISDEMFYTNKSEDIWPNTLQGAYSMLCWVLENGYFKQK